MFVLNFANNTGLVFYKIEYEILIIKFKIHVLKNKNCFVFRNIKLKRVQKIKPKPKLLTQNYAEFGTRIFQGQF